MNACNRCGGTGEVLDHGTGVGQRFRPCPKCSERCGGTPGNPRHTRRNSAFPGITFRECEGCADCNDPPIENPDRVLLDAIEAVDPGPGLIVKPTVTDADIAVWHAASRASTIHERHEIIAAYREKCVAEAVKEAMDGAVEIHEYVCRKAAARAEAAEAELLKWKTNSVHTLCNEQMGDAIKRYEAAEADALRFRELLDVEVAVEKVLEGQVESAKAERDDLKARNTFLRNELNIALMEIERRNQLLLELQEHQN